MMTLEEHLRAAQDDCERLKRLLASEREADAAALRAAEAERDRQLWECEKCGFRFSREHENADGSGYSCPVCELAAGATREARLREALEQIANPDQRLLHTSAGALQEMARAALSAPPDQEKQ